ncbi:hypothetical protein V6N11_070534 [Hibiscus sabdariffa]|uniref:Uncharacterized protein n=1 Tax=Hibiscus sabdariffa TaxID=183260 RepID=A0ABR2QFS6_9ROSI
MTRKCVGKSARANQSIGKKEVTEKLNLFVVKSFTLRFSRLRKTFRKLEITTISTDLDPFTETAIPGLVFGRSGRFL